jgi:hypothetical protein
MEKDIEVLQSYNLLRLHKYLNYNFTGTAFLLIAFFIYANIIFLTVAAFVFTPFMLYDLYKENKKGWIITFLVMVCIPFLALLLVYFSTKFNMILLYILIGLYYLYCFLLRHEVNEWVSEDRAKKQYLLEKKARDEELKLFMNQVENKL